MVQTLIDGSDAFRWFRRFQMVQTLSDGSDAFRRFRRFQMVHTLSDGARYTRALMYTKQPRKKYESRKVTGLLYKHRKQWNCPGSGAPPLEFRHPDMKVTNSHPDFNDTSSVNVLLTIGYHQFLSPAVRCDHSSSTKCLKCVKQDPFDEEYLRLRDPPIKHLSFYAYLRKLKVNSS
ncbi:hypothetical protein GJ496_008758 [Pomphorhynchus laevis]|nr:hypothetical protein GJ496_008758 [Pomphorhynchus laevis]